MCKLQSPIATAKPDITFYEIGLQAVQNELNALNIQTPVGLWDSPTYYYTTLWGIKEAVKYCRKVYPFPKYQTAIMDCDDFAILLKGLMSAEFEINDFGIALGMTPMGYHCFNIARIEDRRVFIEPQTGEVFEIGEKGYQCDRVIQ
uniref:Agglutinin C-terminal domain-containing protein n=2 Tax=viral metagenome TaxID=1070528 RepID=A0A6M3IGN5_9ZZZZ